MRTSKLLVPGLALTLFALPGLADAKDHGNGNGNGNLECVALHGPFTSQTGDPCESPVGLCTHGLLEGEFEATYDFTFLTLQPDPNDPSRSVYTGISVVTALDGSGTLYTEDTGYVQMSADGSPAAFVTKAVIDDATQSYKKTVGGFVATGTLDFVTGSAEGTYSAVLCGKGKK